MIHTKLDLLAAPIRSKAEAAISQMQSDPELKRLGVDRVMVVETLRDLTTQMAYYSRGRMAEADAQAMYAAAGLWKIGEAEARQKITWTLDSKHIRGLAIDIAPVKGGHVWWLAPHDVWERLGVIGEGHGMNWGGRWKNKDGPHFEV
jgi:hypothetical protein